MTTTRKFDFITGVETSQAPTATDPGGPSDPITLGYADRNYTQGTEAQATNTALKNLDTTDREDGDLILVKATGFLYRYDSSSSVADDGEFYLAPVSNVGRYIKVSAIDPATGNLDVPGDIDITGSVTVGGDVTITGDATINGTLTTINSSELNIVDANITINDGGTKSTADTNDAGFTVEMSDATDCKVGFDSTLTSKFMCGEVGAEEEIVTTGHVQTFTAAKTFSEETSFAKALVTTELGSAPSTPSAGKRKIYATSTGYKQIDSAGLITDLGGSGGGSGSGEINIITDTNTAANWSSTGAGMTVATSTTGSELPLQGVLTSGIKITPVSGTTDYVYYRFTLPEGLANTKLKLQWYQEALSGYTSGDLKVELHLNSQTDYLGSYSEVSLSSDDTSGDSYLANIKGKFVASFDSADGSSSGSAYELRFKRVSGTTAVVLQSVIVGPGAGHAFGPVVGKWTAYTPTLTAMTSTDIQFEYKQVGDSVQIRGKWLLTTGAGTEARVSLPSGMTIGGNQVGTIRIGDGNRAYSTTGKDISVLGVVGNAYINFAVINDDNASQNPLTLATGAGMGATGNYIYIHTDMIPIAELAASSSFNIVSEDNLSEWTAFTPTGSLTTNVTYSGTKRRVGDTMFYKVNIAFTGTNTEGLININIPDGLIDTTKIPQATIYETPLGVATIKDSSASGAIYPAYVGYNSTSSVRIVYDGSGAVSSIANSSTSSPIVFASGDDIHVDFSVPIVELAGGSSSLIGFSEATSSTLGLVKKQKVYYYHAGAVYTLSDNGSAVMAHTLPVGKYMITISGFLNQVSGGNCTATFRRAGSVLHTRTGTSAFDERAHLSASYSGGSGLSSQSLTFYYDNTSSASFDFLLSITGASTTIGSLVWKAERLDDTVDLITT